MSPGVCHTDDATQGIVFKLPGLVELIGSRDQITGSVVDITTILTQGILLPGDAVQVVICVVDNQAVGGGYSDQTASFIILIALAFALGSGEAGNPSQGIMLKSGDVAQGISYCP